jgi:hypothetical protein
MTLICKDPLIIFQQELFQKIKISFFSLRVTRARVWKARIDSPLFNVQTYTTNLERLYRVLWDKYERGEDPDHACSY